MRFTRRASCGRCHKEGDVPDVPELTQGRHLFETQGCRGCHKLNGVGGSIGPDLTNVSQRFQRKEVLESIVYPSQVVSDQYASRTVVANGRTYTGIATKDAQGNVSIVQSDGHFTEIPAADIESSLPHAGFSCADA